MNVMHSAARCLATIFSCFAFVFANAQDREYICGYGCIHNADGSIDSGKSIDVARQNLYKKILEEVSLQVSSHTVLENKNGEKDYKSVTAVDSGAILPENEIEIIHYTGFWIARIERSKVFPQEVKWVEQNITVNNTTTLPQIRYGNNVRSESITKTTRRTDYVGPSGGVVKTIPGKTTTVRTKRRWDGRCGSTRTTTVTK